MATALDVSDPLIQQAYEDVRSDSTKTNWLLLEYAEGSKDKLKLAGSGEGGLSAVRELLKSDQAAYAYVRMTVGNDDLSQRCKFLLVSWCGSQVKVMRRAKMAVHFASVKSVIKAFAVQIEATELDDLNEDTVIVMLKKAMGANYDRQSTDY